MAAQGSRCTGSALVPQSSPWGYSWFLRQNEPAPGNQRFGSPRLIAAFGALVFFVAYTSWYLSLFTTHIYTNIPGQFGGGKPSNNKLLFFSDKAKSAEGLGIEIQPDSKFTVPVSLLFETVVRMRDGRGMRLSKELIAAVQVEN